MTDVLFYGDTQSSAAMRHELPVAIGDPFLLAVVGGRLHVMASNLERNRIAAAAPGRDELVAGDVVAIEPGLRQSDIGEVRFEDLLLVTTTTARPCHTARSI